MKYLTPSCICLLLFSSTQAVQAQKLWNLEFRGNLATATQDLGDADLDTGFGFEGTIAYRFMPHLAAYAGWSWQQFSAEESFVGTDTDFEETGYRFGLQFIHPIGDTKYSYLLSAGGLYNHIEVENDGIEFADDTGHGFGFEIGAGLVFPLNENWNFIPNIRYRYLARSIKINEQETDLDLSYLSFGASLTWSF